MRVLGEIELDWIPEVVDAPGSHAASFPLLRPAYVPCKMASKLKNFKHRVSIGPLCLSQTPGIRDVRVYNSFDGGGCARPSWATDVPGGRAAARTQWLRLGLFIGDPVQTLWKLGGSGGGQFIEYTSSTTYLSPSRSIVTLCVKRTNGQTRNIRDREPEALPGRCLPVGLTYRK